MSNATSPTLYELCERKCEEKLLDFNRLHELLSLSSPHRKSRLIGNPRNQVEGNPRLATLPELEAFAAFLEIHPWILFWEYELGRDTLTFDDFQPIWEDYEECQNSPGDPRTDHHPAKIPT